MRDISRETILSGQRVYAVRSWAKKNLFSSWYNTLLTCVIGFFLFNVLKMFIPWGVSADWRVIPMNLKIIMTGAYPRQELWRIWTLLGYIVFLGSYSYSHAGGGVRTKGMILITVLPAALSIVMHEPGTKAGLISLSLLLVTGLILGRLFVQSRHTKRIVTAGWVGLIPLMFLLVGGCTGPEGILPVVATNYWGGLLLSLIIAVTTVITAFPLGLLLALGRRSRLIVFRWFSIAVIEIIRGVPLITLLFLGYLILPMALPANIRPGVLLRAMAGIILFHSAYMAENIRGGFQGVPKTQFEAAYSMGFNNFQSLVLIILPQVIRNIIPVLVSSFTSMIKDTSLISIIGLLDLIGISTAIGANPEFMHDSQQVILFMSLIYFILCFSISRASRKIESRYGH